MNDNQPNKPIQRGLSAGDAILYAVIGSVLTYFFFSPLDAFFNDLFRPLVRSALQALGLG